MWMNYLFSGVRQLRKNFLFSFISIAGLALGLASCIAILLFVRDELSYDTFWPDKDRVYQATWHSIPTGRAPIHLSATPGPFGPLVQQDFADDIEAVTRIMSSFPTIIRDGEGVSASAFYVDSTFFDIFQADFIHGNRQGALSDVTDMIVTQEAALKYFGQVDVIGHTVVLNTGRTFKITGVIANLPEQSHLDYEIIVPLQDSDFSAGDVPLTQYWDSVGFYTYFKLRTDGNIERVLAGMPAFLDRHVPKYSADFVASKRNRIEPVALADIHLKGASRANLKPKGDMTTLYSFAGIALLILIVACMNFINLATVRMAARSREVAIRKVMGASKKDIIAQFITETVIVVILAIVAALTVVEIGLPYLNEMLSKVLRLDYVSDPLSLAMLAGLGLVTVIGAGLHPALVSSGFRPATVISGGRSENIGSIRLRSFLVVLQFAVSIFLITATTLVFAQLKHMQSLDKGFSPENILIVNGMAASDVSASSETFKQNLLADPEIASAGFSWTLPGYGGRSYGGVGSIDGEEISPTAFTLRYVGVDYFETYQMELIAGRYFDKERIITDSVRDDAGKIKDGTVVLNQSVLLRLGFANPDDAIGAVLGSDENRLTVIGVVADTLVDNVASGYEPIIYTYDPINFERLGIRYSTSDEVARKIVEETWKEVFPLVPIRVNYLDQILQEQFAQDEEKGLIFAVFAGLAVLISLLGLYGLATYASERKAKEISVRKVLGASVVDVTRLLVWQFSKPVLLASLIAWPVAFMFTKSWLSHFPSQIDMHVMLFIGPSIVALLLAWVTVGGHAIKVARAKPTHALRRP